MAMLQFPRFHVPVSPVSIALVMAAAVTLAGVAMTSMPARAQEGAEPVVQLYAGWNPLVYQGIALPLPDALNDARESVSIVWYFDAPTQAWSLWSSDLPPALNGLTALKPGGIYFLFSDVERTWTQPLSPPEPVPEPEPPATPGLWSVRFTRTTVLFELMEVIEFDETGAGTVSANEESASTTVSGAPLEAVGQMLLDNEFLRAWPADTRSGCVSCFRYTVMITSPAGAVITLETDDQGMSGALFILVNQLASILIPRLSF